MKIHYPKSNCFQLMGIFILSILPFAVSGQTQTPGCQANEPGNLTVISTTQTTATFAWLDAGSNGGEGYYFEVRTDGAPGSNTDPLLGFVTSGVTDNTSVTVGNLEVDNDEYVFYIQYVCNELNTSTFAEIPFETMALAPPVASAAAFVEDDSFLAIWQPSEGAASYLLDVSTDPTFTDPEQFVGDLQGFDPDTNEPIYNFFYNNWSTTGTSRIIDNLNPLSTYYYRVQAVLGSVTTAESNVITVTTGMIPPDYVIWTSGGWTSDPSTGLPATMIADFDSSIHGNIDALTLTIDEGVVVQISSGGYAYVVDEIVNNAGPSGFIIKSNGNLLQENDAVNVGDITVERESSLIKRLDYTMWSSPTVEGTTTDQTLKQFSPMTVNNRFYVMNTANNVFSDVDPNATTFEEGRGYLIRVANDHSATTPARWTGVFKGIPNNGDVNVTLSDAGQRYNLVGNPYASAISAANFVQTNATNISGTLYFWRRTNNPDEAPYDAQNTYYATYTYVGGTATEDEGPASEAPNGFIKPGQGFVVQAQVGQTSVQFTNGMRSYQHFSNQFFRGNSFASTENNELEKHRIWLNLTNEGGAFSQTLLGYVENATDAVDFGFDGLYINDAGIALTSFLDNNEYTIQGRSLPFNVADVVPLNFKTPIPGSYTISIFDVDGLFAGDQDIYLRDNLTAVTHNLKDGPYTFATEAGNFSDRFEVLYQTALGINDPALNANNIVVYKQNGQIMINSGAAIMASVKVYDIRGRLLAENTAVNASETSINPGAENQVLIVQITTNDKQVVSKKVVN